jgi:hypothetical protein
MTIFIFMAVTTIVLKMHLGLVCFSILLIGCERTKVVNAYFDTGKLKSTYAKVNGRIDGQYLEYYPDGTIKESRDYLQGELTGAFRQYNDQGVLTTEMSYEKGLKQGVSVQYFNDGKPFMINRYHKGTKVGEELQFAHDKRCVAINRFDSAGNLLLRQSLYPEKHTRVYPLIQFETKNVSIGKYCKLLVSFGYPLQGKIDFKVESLDTLAVPFVRIDADTINDRYLLRLHYVEPGIHKFRLGILHDAMEGDTLSADGVGEDLQVVISDDKAAQI